MPKLAEVKVTIHGIFFTSRIAWLPSDELTLPPWSREHLLGPGLDDTSYQMCMEDDDYLRDVMHQHDGWSQGVEASGERWLRSTGPSFIVELVEFPEPMGARGLWVRCKVHPRHAKQLASKDLIAATR